jgi:hypothetical protein
MSNPDLIFFDLSSYLDYSEVREALSSRTGVKYNFVDSSLLHYYNYPVYMYNPEVIRLQSPNRSIEKTPNQLLTSSNSGPELVSNPLDIPMKSLSELGPLAAAWETLDGENRFFSLFDKYSASVFLGNGQASEQATSDFVRQLHAMDPATRIIAFDAYNSSVLQDLGVLTNLPRLEQYVDVVRGHGWLGAPFSVSKGVGTHSGGYEYVHVSTWQPQEEENVVPEDVIVAKIDVCGLGAAV